MCAVRIRLFGQPAVQHDGTAPQPTTRSETLLLAYLVLRGDRMHHRDQLAAVLWGDAPGARARLRTTLTRMRALLEPDGTVPGTYLVTSGAGEVGLEWSGELRSDLADFEAAAAPALADRPLDDARRDGLARALTIWRARLLDGFTDHWVIVERARLHDLGLAVMHKLMTEGARAGAWEQVLELGTRILAEEPLRESVHRAVIRAHLELGHRAAAQDQYLRCVDLLRRELDIGPMPETAELGRPLRAEAAAEIEHEEAERLEAACRGLREAMERLFEAQRLLRLGEPRRGTAGLL